MAKNLVNDYDKYEDYVRVEKIKSKSKNSVLKKKFKDNKHKSTEIDWSKFDDIEDTE